MTIMRKQRWKVQTTPPETFVPQIWNIVDRRHMVAQEIRRRYEEVKHDCGADSFQRDLLHQQVVFLAVRLETTV